jgi:hexosaminidase
MPQFFKLTKCFFLVLLFGVLENTKQVSIIPYPNSVVIHDSNFVLSASSTIYYTRGCKKEAAFLKHILLSEHQLHVYMAEQNTGFITGNVYLIIVHADAGTLGTEGYKLKVDQNNIIVTAPTTAGIFYGIQSLRQLIQKHGNKKSTVQSLTITDRPRFPWRAFMLDEARHFKGTKVVKDLLDQMALLKMNIFHWHLTDDQGWRIEIKKYPKLTKIGSKRTKTEIGTWLSNKFDSAPHAGYYSQNQVKDIIKYAADRHITIIPSIEMPGHASAAIASYPWLGSADTLREVPGVFGMQFNLYNIANPRVHQFIHDVLDELMVLFPAPIIHIGGDEVLHDQWEKSAEVNAYMKQNDISSYADLQISFTNAVSHYLEHKNHRMMGWNEIMDDQHHNTSSLDARDQQTLASNAIIHFWRGDLQIMNRAAEKGYDIVNAHDEFTYLDYDYYTINMQRAYSFDPVPESMPTHLRSKVLGLSCHMWGEWIPTVKSMNYQIFPRIATYAETGWTEQANKEYNRFKKALSVYLKIHWRRKGITILPEQE